MQTNQYPNGFTYSAGQARQTIPGLKVAYGDQAQQLQHQPLLPVQIIQAAPTPTKVGKNPFGRLVEKLVDLVTDVVPGQEQRPIGMSQLAKKTFQASTGAAQSSFFKNSQTAQDYRFQLPPKP